MSLYSNFISQHPDIFEKYSPIEYFTSSSIGEMYISQGGVLTLVNNTDLPHLIREIDILSTFSHPCIGEMKDYAIGSSVSVIVTPRGIGIERALVEGMVSFEDVVTDILSGIYYLHSVGVCHHNLKKSNIIYYPSSAGGNGRCKIIDFKYAERCEKLHDEYFCFQLSKSYPDPEEVKTGYPIRAELYSVGMLIYSLFEDPPLFYPDIRKVTSSEMISEIYFALTQFLSERSFPKSLESRMRTRISRDIENGGGLETIISKPVDTPLIDSIYPTMIEDLVIAGVNSMEAFLVIHNMKRMLSSVDEIYKLSKNNLMSVFRGNLYLVKCLSAENITSKTPKFYRLISEIMKRLDGVVVVRTPYDCVCNRKDLPLFFGDMLKSDYTFDGIPPSTDQRNSRRISFEEYSNEVLYFKDLEYKRTEITFYPVFETIKEKEMSISKDYIRVNPFPETEIGSERVREFIRSIVVNRHKLPVLTGGEGSLIARSISKTGLIERLLGWSPTDEEIEIITKDCINPFSLN